MRIKDRILDFAKAYDSVRKESLRTLNLAKPRVTSINDALTIQSYLDKDDFYFKGDLLPIIKLIEKYKIKNTLRDGWIRYTAIEKELIKIKISFERFGLKNVSIGPISIAADLDNDSILSIKIDTGKNDLEISIFLNDDSLWNDNYKKFVDEFKAKINNLLMEKIR